MVNEVKAILMPTPMTELFSLPPPLSIESYYKANKEGLLVIELSTDCDTSKVVLDEKSRTVSTDYDCCLSFLLPCCRCMRQRHTWHYEEIGNVGYRYTGEILNELALYTAVIVLKDKKTLSFTPFLSAEEAQRHALAMHFYLYGRNNPAYIKPEPTTLFVPE
eukprot:gene10093-11174_t